MKSPFIVMSENNYTFFQFRKLVTFKEISYRLIIASENVDVKKCFFKNVTFPKST